MWYNLSCRDVQNTGALSFSEAAVFSQFSIAGKAPSKYGLTSLAARLDNGGVLGGRFAMIKKNWKGKVYKKNHSHYPENWEETRLRVFKRDRYTCIRCLKHNGRGTGLTAHHLIPRSEGGGDNDENLVTLCSNCHDFVEIYDLRTNVDIIASLDFGVEIRQVKVTTYQDNFDRPSWHTWVYGGLRNPNLDR